MFHKKCKKINNIFNLNELLNEILYYNKKEDFNTSYKIKCPLCKVYNTISKIFKILPICFRIYVCENCYNLINKNKLEVKLESSSLQNGFFPDNDEGSEKKAIELMGDADGKIYVSISGRKGCSFWYRRKSRYDNLDKLFMHNDDWGRYGGPGKISEHSMFIKGYTQFNFIL
jgi:hypothetical protein